MAHADGLIITGRGECCALKQEYIPKDAILCIAGGQLRASSLAGTSQA
jgi:hypothetical protein